MIIPIPVFYIVQLDGIVFTYQLWNQGKIRTLEPCILVYCRCRVNRCSLSSTVNTAITFNAIKPLKSFKLENQNSSDTHWVISADGNDCLPSGWMSVAMIKHQGGKRSREKAWKKTREPKSAPGCDSRTKSCRRCLMEAGVWACTSPGPPYWSEASRGEEHSEKGAAQKIFDPIIWQWNCARKLFSHWDHH